MRIGRCIASALTALAGTAPVVLLPAGTAGATLVARGMVDVDKTFDGSGFTACASGTAASAGSWLFEIRGYRLTTNVSDSLISFLTPRDAAAFPLTCAPLSVLTKRGTDYGGFTATLRYLGTGADNALLLVGYGTWDPVLHDSTSDMSN